VLSGETRYFRDWALLITYLQVKLQALEQSEVDDQIHDLTQ
jgi:hypothetical protein